MESEEAELGKTVPADFKLTDEVAENFARMLMDVPASAKVNGSVGESHFKA